MSMLAVPLIAVFASIMALLSLFIIYITYKKLQRQFSSLFTHFQSHQLLLDEMQMRLSEQDEMLKEKSTTLEQIKLESDQVSKQLEHRIKVLQQQQKELQTNFEQVQAQQPEDKLYSRASKLVTLGADIEEIMRECDIPKAEAEMLLSVHRKKIND